MSARVGAEEVVHHTDTPGVLTGHDATMAHWAAQFAYEAENVKKEEEDDEGSCCVPSTRTF